MLFLQARLRKRPVTVFTCHSPYFSTNGPSPEGLGGFFWGAWLLPLAGPSVSHSLQLCPMEEVIICVPPAEAQEMAIDTEAVRVP